MPLCSQKHKDLSEQVSGEFMCLCVEELVNINKNVGCESLQYCLFPALQVGNAYASHVIHSTNDRRWKLLQGIILPLMGIFFLTLYFFNL